MTAKKRPRIRKALPPMPLSELPIMKALLGLPALPASGSPASKPATEQLPKTQVAALMSKIIDKLQVLALRRPRALIIVAQVLDGLLKRQLEVLDDDDDDTEDVDDGHGPADGQASGTRQQRRTAR